MNPRAQSETIGVILLVGVVTLVISTFGVYYLGSIDQNPGPTTNVDSHVTAEEIRLTHDGGDVVDTADLRVVVRADGTDTGIEWDDYTKPPDLSPQFEPDETWSVNVPNNRQDVPTEEFDSDTEVRIILVHEPTNSVVYDTVTSPDSS
jgi:FlaG/FlaF family flagellin (archaellin)